MSKPEPKYKPGDRVKITDQHDPFCGKIAIVTGLSPSTLQRRSPGNKQWRYRVIVDGVEGGIYVDENEIARVQ